MFKHAGARYHEQQTLARLPDRKSNLPINSMFCVDFLFFFEFNK